MSDSVIVINADGPECRVALIENGILSELYLERERERGTVGNVYKGKVLRVLPGMQAAFVDIGEEKAAFLYAGDIAPAEANSSGKNAEASVRDDGELKRPNQHLPIQDAVRPGQEILVQVVKDPISSKGARITSYVSLPGRNVVFMPTVSHVGISRRVTDDTQRKRIRKIIDRVRQPGTGFIVRTCAEEASTAQLYADTDYLQRLWENLRANEYRHRAPVLLYRDLDLMLRAVRDHLSPEVSRVIVDDSRAYARIRRYIEAFLPEYAEGVELYSGSEPIFDGYGIEIEINRALERKVDLRSGGSLVFDQGEALTSIDVNTGKFVGSKGKTLEETITQTNLEAAEEIAGQLRLRNVGGLVIIDFIDMDKESNRRKVYRKLQEALKRDRAKAHITKISEMGLVEMSRKRTRESLERCLAAPCETCHGRGYTKSASTMCYEILRQVRREASRHSGEHIVVHANPAVADLLNGVERPAVDETVKRIHSGIEVLARKGYHPEKFEIRVKKGRAQQKSRERSVS